MSDYGIKISKEGYDVKTAEDKNLIMSSKFNMLKSKATGVFSGAGTLAHGLSYTPIFFIFAKDGSGNISIYKGNGGADSTNLIFEGATDKRYYVFYQQAV